MSPALLNGHDLRILGLKPGPLFKEILTALEDEQFEGQILNREEALEWVCVFYPEFRAG